MGRRFGLLAALLFLACNGSARSSPQPGGAGGGAAAAPDAGGGAVGPPAGNAGAPNAGPASAVDPGLLPSSASGWTPFAARRESAPSTSTPGPYVLSIEGRGASHVYGGWTARAAGLQGGAYYRFTARAVPRGIASLRESVTIVLRWSGSFGEEVSPDYVWDFRRQSDGSILFDRVLQAPPGSSAVDVQLILQSAPNGQVAFDGLSLAPAAAPAARNVRVAAIYARPSGSQSGTASVQQAAQFADEVAAAQHPDVIVMGEMLNLIGAPGGFEGNAEPIPGPSTGIVAAIAKARHVNIVLGLVEKEGDALYNAAVLIDRSGNVAGKHRKVQLPLDEAAGGLAPGDSVAVFDADFGRVALLICQETSFPEPAREAALQGAEILLVPIWGGRSTLVHARAVENGIYLAASGYDYKSEVVDPLGNVLATANIGGRPEVAVADIDLGRRFRQDFLGDWRDIANKERRATPYQVVIP